MNNTTITMNYSLRICIYILCCSFIKSISAQPEIENCTWTTFTFENGNTASEGCFVDGKPEGIWNTFYENGILKSSGSRKNFELDGIWNFLRKQQLSFHIIILKMQLENLSN